MKQNSRNNARDYPGNYESENSNTNISYAKDKPLVQHNTNLCFCCKLHAIYLSLGTRTIDVILWLSRVIKICPYLD